jgi:hypothetical protein
MNVERLLKLADLLEADANNPKGVKFDLTAWVQKKDSDGEFTTFGFAKGETIPVSCGTAACAWGLAAISGAFADDGVGFDLNRNGWISPTFNGAEDFDAAEMFFDINTNEVSYLFDPDFYPNSKLRGRKGELYVAKRVRDLAAGNVSADDIENARQ